MNQEQQNTRQLLEDLCEDSNYDCDVQRGDDLIVEISDNNITIQVVITDSGDVEAYEEYDEGSLEESLYLEIVDGVYETT